MKNKLGFSLSEVMVTLSVLGVLAAILIPAITNLTPSSERIMFRKAYYTTERVVNAMISDDSIYPITVTETNATTAQTVPAGFHNTDTTNMGVPAGDNKFCYLFSERVNTVGAVDCVPAGGMSFTTSDGIIWTFTASLFTVDNTSYATADVLSVDVNGSDEPNCFYNATTCKTPDQFRIRIRYDGKMGIVPQATDPVGYSILTNPTDNSDD